MMILRRTSQMPLILLVLLCAVRFNTIACCHERDRSSLLSFKQGVVHPSNVLSSWSSLHDCCHWKGVTCDVDNNRVIFLDLSGYSLRGEINLTSLLALPSLEFLALDDNDFERISMPSINNSVATHPHLLSNSSKLSALRLTDNIHLHIDDLNYWLSQLPSVNALYLSGIHLPGETQRVQSLASLPLDDLRLRDCNLTTSILSIEHANFSSLSFLDLGLNDFTDGLPNWLLNLSKDNLSYLLLDNCNLRGQVPDYSGYRNLELLDLSNNKLTGSIPHWPGRLHSLTLLDLSNNSLYGSIPSNLLSPPYLQYLDISFNELSGPLPEILGQTYYVNIYMSFNEFEGQLPRVSNLVQVLDLSGNYFSGPLSSLLCHNETKQFVLEYLDLSDNYLTQELPDCWKNWTHLSHIYLENNQLVGHVPSTMGLSLHHLKALDLHNNSISGYLPWTFHNCTSLELLNLEGNNFFGSIPTWLPRSLSVVKLRSNQFTGNIPPRVCRLRYLIVLDLANNSLSGSIPHCLLNITTLTSGILDSHLSFLSSALSYKHREDFMSIEVTTKGQQLEYQKNLVYVRSIDLSANKLSGEIPMQLFKLVKLESLNLSYNYLTGEIPKQIGGMKNLESLDFSHNNLHGSIPQSMSGLSFLSVLNLSYNHFNGQIPLGTQLQGFDAWSYVGNPQLCGPPLQKNCTAPEKPDNPEKVEGNGEDPFLKSLYLGMGVGFAVGFWVVCGSLFLNRAWRHCFFRLFHAMVDRIYVILAIQLRRFR